MREVFVSKRGRCVPDKGDKHTTEHLDKRVKKEKKISKSYVLFNVAPWKRMRCEKM